MNPAKTRRGLDVGHGRNEGHSAMIHAPATSVGLPGYARLFCADLSARRAWSCGRQRSGLRRNGCGRSRAMKRRRRSWRCVRPCAAAMPKSARLRRKHWCDMAPTTLDVLQSSALSRGQVPDAAVSCLECRRCTSTHSSCRSAQIPPARSLLYVYRPPGDGGAAQWARIDTERSVRLQPDRYLRLVTEQPPHDRAAARRGGALTPMTPRTTTGAHAQVAPRPRCRTPAAGVYFVRYTALQGTKRPRV